MNFKYHNQHKTKKCKNPKQCYGPYILKAKRYIKPKPQVQAPPQETKPCVAPDLRKSNRSHSSSDLINVPSKRRKDDKPCIICGKHTIGRWPNKQSERYRISELKTGKTRASRFLSAFKYNGDEVSTKCIFLKSIGDIFAADIYYHSNCLRN